MHAIPSDLSKQGSLLQSLAILQDASRQILTELDLKHLLPLLVKQAAALSGADTVLLALWNPDWHGLEVVASQGEAGLAGKRTALGAEALAELLLREEAVWFELAPGTWPAAFFNVLPAEQVLVAPLRFQNELLGVLCCLGGLAKSQSADLPRLISLLGDQTAIAIRNAAQYRVIMRKAMELREANEQLQDLDRMKDQFLGTVSHELRTPLHFIQGFGNLLIDEEVGPLNAEQRRYIGKMIEGGRQLLALVDDLLDTSALQAGQLQLSFECLELKELIAEALIFFGPLASQATLELSAQFAKNLPAVIGDRQRLSQVVRNLVANAIKFTPPGGRIVLNGRLESGMVRVAVVDSGHGIPESQFSLLFERFSQLQKGRSRHASGAGLGLSICKSLIEAHNGTIGVLSPPPLEDGGGQGSVFYFTLPVAPEQSFTSHL